ncbi:DUF4139 domain-containing protein [Aquimarina sp. ERC-38]|uniref:mucoidy inhibitor MuiA family protein n=1 Tax=Aquimarina sp. ERC-38 TaxID=2949996 RepID=UPI002245E033|nr:mucoidy inhibitor MuiA family protein [Aquimarina sp. ERC-38]UZO80704.1 DUF4139 domain-containing protein [Aquimarina sp. ERC-38]
MKKTISLFLFTLINLVSIAQTEKLIDSEIKKVTVYQEGAEIMRQANINLQKGKTTLIFKGLSSKLDSKSIQAKGDNDLMIVSISQNIDYLNKVKISSEIEQLENKKVSIKDSLSALDGLQKVYRQEKEMIIANKTIGGDNGVNITELKNAASFFRSRLTEIENKTRALDKIKFTLKTEFVEISKQLLELNATSNSPTSEVKVVVLAKKATTYKVDLAYVVNDAGWEPNYDLRIPDVNQPLNLFYKAKVVQNTDEDWKNVKLILSTGNPNISNYKPELNTYYLTFNNYYEEPTRQIIQNNQPFKGTVRGTITDAETGEPLAGATVSIKGTSQGTVADFYGKYRMDMPWNKNKLIFTYLGFIEQEQYVNSDQVDVSLKPDESSLDEVVVIGYGSKSDGLQGKVSGIKVIEEEEHIPLAVEKRQTSTEFEIEIPYSIPSNNQPYDVTMVEYQVAADYHYIAVPKLSDDAYLTAKIPDWTKYEMINGKANLFFQGIYQGETYLDLKGFEDTLSISVGRDRDILISREIQKDFSKKSMIGSNEKVLKAWEITIKNTKNVAIDLVIEDQFPISKVADIKIEQIESSGAELNEDDGKLTWKLALKPKEKKVLTIKYEVKYPKNRNLVVD